MEMDRRTLMNINLLLDHENVQRKAFSIISDLRELGIKFSYKLELTPGIIDHDHYFLIITPIKPKGVFLKKAVANKIVLEHIKALDRHLFEKGLVCEKSQSELRLLLY